MTAYGTAVVWIGDGGPSDELEAAAWAWRQKCIAYIAGPPLNGMAQGPLARSDNALVAIAAFAGFSEYRALRCLGRTFREMSPVLDGFHLHIQRLLQSPVGNVRRAYINQLMRALGSDAEEYLWPVLREDPQAWTRAHAVYWLARIARRGDAAAKLRIFAAAVDCFDAETSMITRGSYRVFSYLLGAPEMERLFPGRALVKSAMQLRGRQERDRMQEEDRDAARMLSRDAATGKTLWGEIWASERRGRYVVPR